MKSLLQQHYQSFLQPIEEGLLLKKVMISRFTLWVITYPIDLRVPVYKGYKNCIHTCGEG